MKHVSAEKLCAILVAKKVFTQKDVVELLKDFEEKSKESFESFLLSEGLAPKEILLPALSECYGVPFFDAMGYFFNHELLMIFPRDFLIKHKIIPVERDNDILIVLAAEPDDENLVPELSEYVPYEIQFYVGIADDIVEAIVEYSEESPFQLEDNDEDDFVVDEEGYDDTFHDDED